MVYDGSGYYFDLTGLEKNTTYHFAVYEYNTSDAGDNDYLTTTYLTGNAATNPWPTVQTNGLSATGIQGTQATINFTAGDGATRLFFMKANTPVDAAPNLVSVNAGHSTSYGGVEVGSTR